MDTHDSGDSEIEDTLKAMGFPIDRSLEVCKEEEIVFKKGLYKFQKISYVAKRDATYFKKKKKLLDVASKQKKQLDIFSNRNVNKDAESMKNLEPFYYFLHQAYPN